MESRAAARSLLERQDQEIEILMITDWPKNSRLSQDAEGRYVQVIEEPAEGSEKPIGQATLNGEVYEVYGDPSKPELFLKAGTGPVPTIRLPRAKVTVHISNVADER